MIVTANSIPVPDPRAPVYRRMIRKYGQFINIPVLKLFFLPSRSAITDKAPMQAPPKAAAVGITRFNSLYTDVSRWPAIIIPCSLSCLATSRGEELETSIHVLENNAQADKVNVTYKTVCIGSLSASIMLCGGEMKYARPAEAYC